MIKTISIVNYKSFHPSTPKAIELDTSKQATFIYGLNGAGKSAIGEVIHGRSTQDPAFDQCQVETTGTGPFRYLVYNHGFVNRVINESMQGIFTIGETDSTKQAEIDRLVAENTALETKLDGLVEKESASKKLVEDQISRGVDEIWKAHGKGKSTTLASLLTGYGRDKKKFFEELRGFAVEEGTPLDSMARLEERWKDASSTETEKIAVEVDFTALTKIENDPIWAEVIAVSASSRLAELIAKLGNGDWVEQGREYVENDTCPFCQQGLPHDFQNELAKLLEGERELKIGKIKSLAQNYKLLVEQLTESMASAVKDDIAKGTGLELAWSKLNGKLQANLSLMADKEKKPSNSVSVDVIDHSEMTQALSAVKDKVDDFNRRIQDRRGEQASIKKMFLQVLCADRAEAYASHDAALAPLNDQWAADQKEWQDTDSELKENNRKLSELRQSQTGVDASVDAINDRLKNLGIDSFSIRRADGEGHLYCLARPNQDSCDTFSLSEGEKTLISFLYFMELIKGTHDEHGVVEIAKTIIVIDDPISSMSQNFVYDVATIIQHELIKPPQDVKKVRQTVVLTHNLFFFHELVRQASGRRLENAHNKCQMLRVHKGKYSDVSHLDPQTYMNDYDALWQTLRDAKDNPALARAVPNTMRCILEQFFAFTTGIDDFQKALETLAGQDSTNKFKALERYLDRGSHKDGINGTPMDWSQYDVNYYLEKLRSLFKETNNETHYLRRMGDEAVEAA